MYSEKQDTNQELSVAEYYDLLRQAERAGGGGFNFRAVEGTYSRAELENFIRDFGGRVKRRNK